MHNITLPTGAQRMVPSAHKGEQRSVREAWQDVPGHVPGQYSNANDEQVQELCLAWRLTPGASVKDAMLAMRMQSGGMLCRAADKAARRQGFDGHVAARKAAGVAR